MKRLYRRLLFFISTILFLTLAPLVILYAMGYRSVATSVDPVPVGVVLIETFPRRADVRVNDRDVGKTPRAVSNVAAGSVYIKLTKEGYIDWEKTIPVKPGLVSELRGVRLWLKNREPKVLATGAELLALSPNRQLLAVYFGNKTLQIFDKEGTSVTEPTLLRRTPQGLLWAPDNATLLLQNVDASHEIFSVTATTPRRLPALQGVVAAAWDPRIPGRLITQNQQGTIRVYNTTTQASTTVATRATHFGLSGRQIYVLHQDGSITIHNLQGTLLSTLPLKITGTVESLMVTPEGRVALIVDKKLQLLSDDKLVDISENVLNAQWSPDGRILLVQTDANSLYVYNEADERIPLPLQELQLVTRLSREIKSPQWFAGGQHVLYQVEDEIHVMEIDTRDHAIEEVLDTTNLGEAHAMVGEDGETLLYLKREDGKTNLVVMPLVSN